MKIVAGRIIKETKTIRNFLFEKSDFVKKHPGAANCSAFENLLSLLDVPQNEWKDVYAVGITLGDFRLHKSLTKPQKP